MWVDFVVGFVEYGFVSFGEGYVKGEMFLFVFFYGFGYMNVFVVDLVLLVWSVV